MPESWTLKAQEKFFNEKLPVFKKAQKDRNVAAAMRAIRSNFFVIWSTAAVEDAAWEIEEANRIAEEKAKDKVTNKHRKKARMEAKTATERVRKTWSSHEAWHAERSGVSLSLDEM